jgi:hypothetical protein
MQKKGKKRKEKKLAINARSSLISGPTQFNLSKMTGNSFPL